MKASGEHRRGRSMGSSSPVVVRSGEKDEDLALFHEMKRREKHNFLHPSPDDLDATLSSKFGGMGAPTKKPGTDLLTSESDKNDYDWLLTPPGTPLFPSLDQEAAALAVLSPALSNGSYSSASSASKSLKSSTYSPSESGKGSRGNPSPRRQISTGSTTPNGISRSRSSPGTAPVLTRPSTPTSQGGTRPSTPTSKSSQAAGRSSTPNLKLTISHSSKSYSTATTPTGTRTSTPTPRSSTPPIRPSTPGGRSSTPTSKPSTPTMRRSLSGGRTNITSPSPTSTRGGPSPKRSNSASRGNSPSAKRITSVITSIAGMSSEVPPNLRTTMPERSTSTGKANGSSNYNNGEESAQNRRRPRSPSVARSFSSSSSQEQRTSSQTSRGSVISPYDDGLEVNRPSTLGSNRNSATGGKWHATGPEELMGGKTSAFAKRVAKSPFKETSGYGVTPSRTKSDPVKRTVDAYQNSPTTAYRHLHSNSPGSPFYSTRANSLLLRAGVAMNSSMTTSSNASSEHGTTIAADTEGSERDEDDLLSWDSYGRRASMSPRLQQADILVLDKDDEKTAPWQDSIFDRAHSREPSSSHSQGSQSTLDAEVTGFYETDGIASLEMLEQLGVMGENYPLKKSSSLKSRSAEKQRASSKEDIKAPSLRPDEYNHARISPRKVFQESQGSPARNLAHLEKQESLERSRRSRDVESKIPPHLIFQENLQASPARQLSNLEKQEHPERPRKSRDFESKSSPRRAFLESQGSPARQHLAQVEKHDSYASPRKSRDFEARISPRRAGQGSPARHLGHLGPLEKLEVSAERPRRSQDFETELLKRNGEKPLGLLEQPQVHNSEIRAACLFVRDFKVGVSPPRNFLNSPLHHAQGNSPVLQKNGIEEMEMRLRNELQYDWENSVETIEQPVMDSNELDRKLSDSPILVPLPNNKSVGSPQVPTVHESLELPFTPADAVHQMTMNESPVTPEKSNLVGVLEPRMSDPPLMIHKHVDLDDHPIAINGAPSSAVFANSAVHDVVMDENEAESLPIKEVDQDSPIPPERSPSSVARVQSSLFTSHVLGIQSNQSDDGVCATDEDTAEVHVPEDGAAIVSGSEAESGGLEECLEGREVHSTEEQHSSATDSAMEVDETSIALPESHGGDAVHERYLQAEVEQEAAPHEEDLEMLQSPEEDAASEALCKIPSSGEDNEQGVVEEEVDGMWYSEPNNYQQDVVERFLLAVPSSVGTNASEVTAEKELLFAQDEHETSAVESDGLQVSERQVEQSVVYSNGNPPLPSSECADALQKESLSDHKMESILGNSTDDANLYACPESPQKLSGHAYKLPAADVQENSVWNNPHLRSDEIECNQERALPESCNSTSVDHGQEDVLPCEAMLEEVEDPMVDSVDLPATQDIVLSNREVQEESHNLEHVDADFIGPLDDTKDEASSNFSSSNHAKQEGLQSPKFCNTDSVMEELHYVSDAEDVEFPAQEISSLHLDEDEGKPEEDREVFQERLTESGAPCVEDEPLPNYGIVEDDKMGSNCTSVRFVDKHSEVLDPSPASEDIRAVVAQSPPRPEFRSASTLCAASEGVSAVVAQSPPRPEFRSASTLCAASEGVSAVVAQSPSRPEFRSASISCAASEDINAAVSQSPSRPEFRSESILCAASEDINVAVSQSPPRPEFRSASILCAASEDISAAVSQSPPRPDFRSASILCAASEDVSAAVSQSPPRPEFRSASTLCAALEEQIAGLIQKIDSAIEESSKPFSSSPQESLLVKDKRSILEPEQDDCTGSMRSSREEDLIDRLWAEDESTSCSEGSRDQDFLTSRECSQREINGVRSSRLSDRFLPISLLGQLNDPYDALGRSSRSDLGVEKRMLEVSSKRHSAVDQQDDLIVDHIHNREPMKSPFTGPLMWSKEMNAQNFGVLEDAHFHLDAQSKVDKSSGEGKGPSNQDEDLRTASFRQEYGSSESSSCFDLEDMKTDAELISLCKVGEQASDNTDMATESSAALVSSEPKAGPVEIEAPYPEEAPEEADDASLVESTREVAEYSEASLSREVDTSNIMSNGDIVALEARDQEAIQLAHNTDREEWLSEETSSRQVPVISHVTEATVVELDEKELHDFKEQEVKQEILEDSSSSSPVDQELEKETQGDSSQHFDQSSREADMECVQESGGEDIDLLRLSPLQKVSLAQESFGVEAPTPSNSPLEEPESSCGREIEDETEMMTEVRGTADGDVEETDSGAERANNSILRENVSTEAHPVDEVELQKSPTHFKGEEIAEGPANVAQQEVTRVSVWSDLPAVTLSSPRNSIRKPALWKEETKPVDEDVGVATENGDLGTREDKESRVGNESFKRLPSNKAKSVRTISLSPRYRTESPFEEPSSPKGEVYTPTKTNALTNITVISPESLQWDHSSPAAETPSKARNSPATLARNMTLAEATDTILYCSSLMHTIVYKAAAYAIEKEELAALASTPVSNGEAPHLSEDVNREETDPEVAEAGNCKPQGVNTTGPPPVRRALSYLGHETVPSKPADTSLQIPEDQVIERVKAPNTPAVQSPARTDQKDAVMPVKTSKAKCGCTIM